MSDGSILFLSKETKSSDKYAKLLSTHYNVTAWPITQKGLYRELPECDYIVVFTDDMDSSDYTLMTDFLNIFPTSWEPIITLGSKTFTKAFRLNVSYPIEKEFDVTKEGFNLLKSLEEINRKQLNKKLQKVSQELSSDATLAVFSMNQEHRNKYVSLFRKVCITIAYDNILNLIQESLAAPPDTFLLDYDDAIEDDFHLLKQIRGSADLCTTPIVLFGSQISQNEFKQILPYKPNGYLVHGSDDTDSIKLVTSRFKKKS